MKKFTCYIFALFVFFVILGGASCTTQKHVVYFEDIADSGILKDVKLPEFTSPVVQTDDILSISIQTIDPLITAQLNQAPAQVVVTGVGAVPQPITGYLVDKAGNVELPLLGKIQVAGLTSSQVQDVVREKSLKYLKDPTVQVRFANFKINVLGEVVRPSTYTVSNEKVSVLDAIALAGDLTILGERENILIIRENNGKKEFARVNLSDSKFIASPYYYLKQNDIIYVAPNKARIASNNVPRNQTITLFASFAALLIALLTRL